MYPFTSNVVVAGDDIHAAIHKQLPPYSIDSGVGVNDGEGACPPRRNIKSKDGLKTTPHPDISTVYELLVYVAKRSGKRDCLGSRELIDTHEETKVIKKMVDGKEINVPKKWTYFELSPYSYISYEDLLNQANSIGAGLVHYGLKPKNILEIYASTRYVVSFMKSHKDDDC